MLFVSNLLREDLGCPYLGTQTRFYRSPAPALTCKRLLLSGGSGRSYPSPNRPHNVPHLIKTTRNCCSHSSKEGTRNLWVCRCNTFHVKRYYVQLLQIMGKSILWEQLRKLYEAKISLSLLVVKAFFCLKNCLRNILT